MRAVRPGLTVVALALALASTAGACHVVGRVDDSRLRGTRLVAVAGEPVQATPGIVLGLAGQVRLLHPLRCPARELQTQDDVVHVETRPNLATFVVGVVTTALGVATTASAVTDDDRTSNPLLYGGPAVLGTGLALMIGPWIGNHTRTHTVGTHEIDVGATTTGCGAAPMAARSALVTFGTLQGVGTVDADGTFALPAFTWVDAFDVGATPTWLVRADVTPPAGGAVVSLAATIETPALLTERDAFLAATGIDGRVQPLTKIPSLQQGPVQVTRAVDERGPHLRIVMPLRNDGPGDAWQVRLITHAQAAELDGRIAYVGHVPAGASTSIELTVPLSAAANLALVGVPIELTVVARDAHATASVHGATFRGVVLSDMPLVTRP